MIAVLPSMIHPKTAVLGRAGGGNTPEWISKNSYVKKVVFDASFANTRPTSCFSWFRGCENLTTIEGIEYLNTENVENMSSMFRDCYALESLDLSSFNTDLSSG